VGAVMLPLPEETDGYVIDTPGLREVGLWALPARELDRCFPEMRDRRDECRFGDCRHVAEPECAVRRAAEEGEISAERYDSYLRLLEELEEHASS
jgi:ribosome biogenesis GTPase